MALDIAIVATETKPVQSQLELSWRKVLFLFKAHIRLLTR